MSESTYQSGYGSTPQSSGAGAADMGAAAAEFRRNVQEASEAANITSYQMRASFDAHASEPGRLTLNEEVPTRVLSDRLVAR